MKYKAKVNNHFEFEAESTQISEQNWDIAEIQPQKIYHIIKNDISYNAEIVQIDPETKTIKVKINQKLYTVKLSDDKDLLLEKMGINLANTTKINHLKAPMPGLVLDIKIQPNQTVQKGDSLLILEAMKMENVLKAPANATIKTICVKKGDAVEKGTLLIEFQ